MTTRPEIVFCADDFTGASDTLATLVRRGLDARLYLRPPSLAGGHEMADLDAIGVATSLRSMPREDATARMREIGTGLASTKAPFNHLKVCSTFDSSPRTGNICAAADAFAEAIGARWIAVIGGQPSLGRYCLFGNLFAAAAGSVHRIDRHPVMSVHPITPMGEADLRLHLRSQGWERIGLVTFPEYRRTVGELIELIEQRQASGERETLFDVSCEEDLAVIGAALRRLAERETMLCVGASSVVEALYAHDAGRNARPHMIASPPRVAGPVFAFAGSRSSVTAEQVKRATTYRKIPITPTALSSRTERMKLVERCRTGLVEHSNILVHLVEGDAPGPRGRALAEATAHFVAEVVAGSRIGCLAIAGGDTSSAAVEQLDLDSISILADFDRGVPLIRAHARNPLDGLPMILKGGQMGSPDVFDALVNASR